jgi:hypothetical protein
VARVWVAVPSSRGDQGALDQELEQFLFAESRGWVWPGSFGEEGRGDSVPNTAVRDGASFPSHVEGVLVVLRRETVHGVASVAVQVVAFGAWDQESVQAIAVQDGTHRMDPRASVGSNGSKEGESDATELINERPARGRHLWFTRRELGPREHRIILAIQSVEPQLGADRNEVLALAAREEWPGGESRNAGRYPTRLRTSAGRGKSFLAGSDTVSLPPLLGPL